jgi:putative spermidine/putrescine transport system substrate-binding protein
MRTRTVSTVLCSTKTISVAVIAVVLAAGFPAFAPAQEGKSSLILNWYPGLLGANFKQSFLDTYDNNKNVEILESFDNARFTQMQANRARPNSDVATFIDVLLPLVARSGLTVKLTEDAIPNLAKVDPNVRTKDDMAVPVTYGSWGIAYNAEKLTKPITSWADLLREDLKGRVSAPNITYNSSIYTLDAMSRLEGGDLRDADAGLKAMRQIRTSGPGLWDQESIAVGWLKTGEIWATPYFSGNVLALMQDPDLKNLRFVVPSEGAYYVPLNVTKLANAPNSKEADRFINHMLSIPAQEAWTKFGRSRPVNTGAAVPDDVSASVPTADKLIRVDWEYFAKNRDAIVNKWNDVVNR